MENLKEIYKNLANSKITFFKLLILLLLSILLVYILTEYDLSTKNLTQSTKNIFFNIENKTYPKLKTEKNEDHPTIFCLIKTHPNNIKINKTWVVYRIWGRKCDNYRFVTLIPKELIPPGTDTTRTFEIFNQYHMIQPEGLIQETHENLTLKLYYSMRYVYAKFPNYDWYHIVDDDAYVNINNFKKFLSDKNPRDPVTYGFDFKVNVRGGYHSGGPGFVLSNEAFSRIGKALTQNIKNCQNSGIDDVDINACLRNLGVSIGRSLDEKNRHRFLVFNLATHFFGPNPDWIRDATMHALPNVIFFPRL